MKEKIKCKKCGLFIDSDCETCPYCGYPQHDENNDKKNDDSISLNADNLAKKETKEDNPKKSTLHFFDFESREMKINVYKNVSLFVVGFIVLKLVAFIFELIASSTGSWYFIFSGTASASINFAAYLITFGIILLILNKDSSMFFKEFKNIWTWVIGVGFGGLLILASSAVNSLMQLFQQSGVNANETSIDSITASFPFLSIFIFGIIGPICEEFTYRAGFFSLLKKYNRVVAYIGTALLFGFLHFTFDLDNLVTELINLPGYMIAGLLLCYFYDYKGIGTSTIAHVTNNLVALISQLLI